ncbi:MAG: hypothetical protein M1819_002510 [Sarea resinae]|nr:MAG: hypothetical protein M1819_002510 [Sarea resinae]
MAEGSPTSMSLAAQQYQEAMRKHQHQTSPSEPPESSTAPPSAAEPSSTIKTETEAVAESQDSLTPLNQSAALSAIPPAPSRTSTPGRVVNGHDMPSSRHTSTHPETTTAPSKATPNGAPARRYLNEKVTTVLLEGMKDLARDQPKDPLRVLGEFLLQKSKELEGTRTDT